MSQPNTGRVGSDERNTGAHFIYNFYQEVANLTHTESQFQNVMVEVSYKCAFSEDKSGAAGKSQVIDLPQADKDILMQAIQNMRYHVVRTQRLYKSILPQLKKKENTKISKLDKSIDEAYNNIMSDFVINRRDSEKYVIAMNQVIVNTVMRDLLTTSQDIMAQLYTE